MNSCLSNRNPQCFASVDSYKIGYGVAYMYTKFVYDIAFWFLDNSALDKNILAFPEPLSRLSCGACPSTKN